MSDRQYEFDYAVHTVGGRLHKMMTDNGLCPKEANAVLQAVKTEKHDVMLAEVLGKSWEEYPSQFHAVAWATVKQRVVDYIDANIPKHLARPMFTDV